MGCMVAAELASEGHDVAVALSPDRPAPQAQNLSPFVLNQDAPDLEAAIRALLRDVGPFDTVILAQSAPQAVCAVGELGSTVWAQALRRNSTLAFLLAREAVGVLQQATTPRMIFLMPEQVRGMPEAGKAAYLASTAPLVGLVRTFALELAGNGMTVNAVACEFPDAEARDRETVTKNPPNSRDIARAISFLIAPASSFINGQTLDVNGGRSMQ